MSLPFKLAVLGFACLIPFYWYSFICLYGIVKSEKPEWLRVRGTFSFLYDGVTRLADPNVQVEVLRIAFGSRVKELQTQTAAGHARRVRVLGIIELVLFTVVLIGTATGAP